MREPQVGDRIRLIGDYLYSELKKGDLGTLESVDEDGDWWAVIDGKQLSGADPTYCVGPLGSETVDFELVESLHEVQASKDALSTVSHIDEISDYPPEGKLHDFDYAIDMYNPVDDVWIQATYLTQVPAQVAEDFFKQYQNQPARYRLVRVTKTLVIGG